MFESTQQTIARHEMAGIPFYAHFANISFNDGKGCWTMSAATESYVVGIFYWLEELKNSFSRGSSRIKRLDGITFFQKNHRTD